MDHLLVLERPEEAALPPALEQLQQFFQASARSENTHRAYTCDLSDFAQWCARVGRNFCPASPDTVAAYISYLAVKPAQGRRKHDGLRPSTIRRHLAAISIMHQEAKEPNPAWTPDVVQTLEGIERRLGVAPEQKNAAITRDVRLMVETLDRDSVIGRRDAALLLLGFAGCFRRSELAGIRVEHVEVKVEGLEVLLPHSKTDQRGEGLVKAICYGSDPATCPVRSYLAWLSAAPAAVGPVFRAIDRHGNVKGQIRAADVARVVKRAAEDAGLDSVRYSGHSLRAGFITAAALSGVNALDMLPHSGHRGLAQLQKYYRKPSLWVNNPTAKVGL